MQKKRWLIGLLSTLLITATAFTVLPMYHSYATSGTSVSVTPSTTDALPVVGTEEKMLQLMKKASEQERQLYGRGGGIMLTDRVMMAPAPAAEATVQSKSADQRDYSTTNVQVEGVDEGDVLKTDGTYLYQATNNRVVITRAYPASEMKVIKTLGFDAENFSPTELYVDQNHLVVIGTTPVRMYKAKAGSSEMIHSDYSPTVHAYVFDIHDKSRITKLRELELDGNYVSSRKIGSSLYLVSSKHVNYYPYLERNESIDLPAYRDSIQSEQYKSISLKELRYFPDRIVPSYLLIGAVNLTDDAAMHVSSYLGSGENVYASTNNLYVTLTKWEPNTDAVPASKAASPSFIRVMPPANQTSSIYKFALQPGSVSYQGKGEVPGTILNQFSLDEHNGYLRIATTNGDIFQTDENTSKNNIYVLDKKLTLKGKLEGIAPGEKIYSVRFMGDRAYMVTFKKVDPLFVIDLKTPESPKILGALKIPGYSDYLHPYDENHVIGFGKDTIEAMDSTRDFAWYQGMKIALFDVTDVTRPVEQFKEIIGDRGTDSELLQNHRALLFSREKNLLAFPVTVMTIDPKEKEKKRAAAEAPAYGEFSFQGAYVYSLDLKNGFQLRKQITHLPTDASLKAGHDWYNSNDNIQRVLYIGDTLYTVSSSKIKAFDLGMLKEQAQLTLPN